jgi:retron-type reverse transcriptase
MEIFAAAQLAERLGESDRLMEMNLERDNIIRAWKRVYANRGAPGVDGMKTGQLGKYLGKHWPKIEKDLLKGTHKPLPVKRKEIPKPGGGIRLLGIPTVLDRFIRQAISQIVEQVWEPTFSEFSCGFIGLRIAD